MIALLSSVAITVVFLQQPFFWDNVLIPAQVGSYFYFNGFHPFRLPPNFDCGHPPLLSLFYSIIWKVLGRTLAISHIVQWPFLFLSFYYLLKIGSRFLSRHWLWLAFGLMLCDTTLLAQASQVGYEFPCIALVLYCFDYLLLLYCEEEKPIYFRFRRICFYIALILLPLIQLRGISMVASIFFIEVVLRGHRKYSFKLVSFYIPYITSANVLGLWLLIHLIGTGYLITNPISSWGADNNGLVSWKLLPLNMGYAIWRLIDFGRLILWILLLIGATIYFRTKTENKKYPFFYLLYLLLIPGFVYSLNFILMNKSICHRYYLLEIMLLPIATVCLLQGLHSAWLKNCLVLIAVASLIAGNFLVYPSPLSNGWDSTLSQLPYFKLREEVKQYFVSEKIQPQTVYSCFPFSVNDAAVNLTPNVTDVVSNYYADWDDEKDKAKPQLVLYSNLCNNFSNATIDTLQKRWPIVKQWNRGSVKIILYRRP